MIIVGQTDVSTSDEYDGDISTSEEENNYYYNEYVLNHDVSLT